MKFWKIDVVINGCIKKAKYDVDMITALRSPTLLVNIGTPPPTVMHDRYPAIIQNNQQHTKYVMILNMYQQNYI